eukprot:COSAG02_NODE_737_length_17855_cov_18.729049_10_plen_100_part_00
MSHSSPLKIDRSQKQEYGLVDTTRRWLTCKLCTNWPTLAVRRVGHLKGMVDAIGISIENGHKALCPLSRPRTPGIVLDDGAGIHAWYDRKNVHEYLVSY